MDRKSRSVTGEYLNDGYEWVVDIDIEQFFDKVNHDKLIQILRGQVNDSTTLNLIRKYLKAGVMEKGLEKAAVTRVPQGGPLSAECLNIYLDKLDKELEDRGLRFTRYADDALIFTKSEMAANRIMKSVRGSLLRGQGRGASFQNGGGRGTDGTGERAGQHLCIRTRD
ncbi:hypothetical protein D3Z47_12930 [Lachnospiraceae bacterium]|nr:hypothetical protein [Lachnospiraceae bacterium]